MGNTTENFRLSDNVIGHIAKSLQIALITGTDIVDNLRLLELTTHNEELVLTPDCEESFNKNLANMMENLPEENSPFSS
jgi:hypothetical protein